MVQPFCYISVASECEQALKIVLGINCLVEEAY